MTLTLTGLRVAVRAAGVRAAYAGHLLGTMGAELTLLEPLGGAPLRHEPPFLPGDGQASALFAYHAAGMRSRVLDLAAGEGRAERGALLSEADVFIDDTPLVGRADLGLDEAAIAAR